MFVKFDAVNPAITFKLALWQLQIKIDTCSKYCTGADPGGGGVMGADDPPFSLKMMASSEKLSHLA